MNINPYRKHDPEKGSVSAKIHGLAAGIAGAGIAAVSATGLAVKGGKGFAVAGMAAGGLLHYSGARTFMAGRKVKKPQEPTV